MINDYRFFQDFYDGQIVREESDNFKMFKILLFSVMSAIGLFMALMGICNYAELILLVVGMVWNFYTELNKKISILFAGIVGLIYFFFATNFNIFATALIYIAVYIPLQLIAMSREYEEGSFVQIRKRMNEYNTLLFFIFMVVLFVVLFLFDESVGARFVVFDSISATLLVCSAVLRNERYNEYFIFRIFALLSNIVLWVLVIDEYQYNGSFLILMMYVSYLIFDVGTYIYQNLTYENQYSLVQKQYIKVEEDKVIEEKLKVYSENLKREQENQEVKEQKPKIESASKPKQNKKTATTKKSKSASKKQEGSKTKIKTKVIKK